MTFSQILRRLFHRPAALAALLVFGLAFALAVSDSGTWERVIAAAVGVGSARTAVWSLRRP